MGRGGRRHRLRHKRSRPGDRCDGSDGPGSCRGPCCPSSGGCGSHSGRPHDDTHAVDFEPGVTPFGAGNSCCAADDNTPRNDHCAADGRNDDDIRASVRRWLSILTIPVGLLWVASCLFVISRNTDNSSPSILRSVLVATAAAIGAVAASLVAIPIAYLAARWLRRHGVLDVGLLNELIDRAQHSSISTVANLQDMPWDQIFSPGNGIDIVALGRPTKNTSLFTAPDC